MRAADDLEIIKLKSEDTTRVLLKEDQGGGRMVELGTAVIEKQLAANLKGTVTMFPHTYVSP